MDWFLQDKDLRHEGVNIKIVKSVVVFLLHIQTKEFILSFKRILVLTVL